MIIKIVQDIVEALNANGDSFEFDHGPDAWNNILSDESSFPKVHMDTPLENSYQLAQGGYIGELYPVKLIFMYKSEMEWTPVEHEAGAIDPANRAIRQFITRCQNSPLIDEVTITRNAISFINLLDVNVSGKFLFINLKENINASVCID